LPGVGRRKCSPFGPQKKLINHRGT